MLKKTILITGANGALAENLLSLIAYNDKYKILASTRDLNKISNPVKGVLYFTNNEIINSNILTNSDYIIHCAFPRSNEIFEMHSSIFFFHNLLHKSIAMNVKNFIHISSQTVYGNYREEPSSEEESNPKDIYALTKYYCELLGASISKSSSMNYTNLRLASLIGAEFPARVINKIIYSSLGGEKIIVQNEKSLFGFMDIHDAAEGLYAFIENSDPNLWLGTYNFGTPPNNEENLLFIAQFIQKLFKEQGIELELVVQNVNAQKKKCTMRSDNFYAIAQWTPRISLSQSIKRIFEGIYKE